MGSGASRPSSRARSAQASRGPRARRHARKRPSTAKSHGEPRHKERAQSTSVSSTLEAGTDARRTPSPYSDVTMESDEVRPAEEFRQRSLRVKSAATSTRGLSRPTTAKSRGGVTVSTQTDAEDTEGKVQRSPAKAGPAPEFYRAVRNAMAKEGLFDKPPTPAVLAESMRVYRSLHLELPSDGEGSLYPCPPASPRSDVIDLQRLAELDDHVCQVPRQLDSAHLFELVKYLLEPTVNEVEMTYVLFRWLTSLKLKPINQSKPRKAPEQKRRDSSDEDDEESDEKQDSDESADDVAGVVKRLAEGSAEHAEVFSSLCKLSGLECRTIAGVTKDYDSERADDLFQSRVATWSAVLVEDEWRLVDCLGGAHCWRATASDRAQSLRRAKLASRRLQEQEDSKAERSGQKDKISTHNDNPASPSSNTDDGHTESKPSTTQTDDTREMDKEADVEVNMHVKSKEDTSGDAAGDVTMEERNDSIEKVPPQTEAQKSSGDDPTPQGANAKTDIEKRGNDTADEDRTDDEEVFEDMSAPNQSGDDAGNTGDGDWFDEEEVATYQGSTLFKLNTFFFLTDPDQLAFSHFPDDPLWQLLPRPVSLAEFYNLNIPYLKPCFFCLGLHLDSIPEKTNLCNTPSINVSLKFPPSVLRKFSYVLTRGGGVEDPRLAKKKINNFLFLETFHRKQEMRITGSLPESGHFFLEVYCKNVLDPSHKAMQHVCTFVFLCTEPVKEPTYYPDNPRAEWGPGADTELLRMLPYSHQGGRVQTTDGEAEVTFTVTSELLYVHQLTSLKQSPGEDLNSFAVHRVECGQATFTVRPPRPGLYGLQLYARPAQDGGGTVPSVCQYLVECRGVPEDEPPTPFPALPGRRLGPTRAFADLGLSVRSPGAALLRPDVPNPLRFQLQATSPLATNTDLRLYRGTDCEDMREFTHAAQKGTSLSYHLRLPRRGLYHLSLSARPEGAYDTPMRVVYHAVVLCRHPQEGVMPFPTFGPAWRHPYVLHRPDGKCVAEESKVSFSCTIPDARAVAVVEGEGEGELRWQDLHPVQGEEERGRWQGDVQLEAGSQGHALSLIARLGEGEEYDKMAEFEVKSKAEMEKYTSNRRASDTPQDTPQVPERTQTSEQAVDPEPPADQQAEEQTREEDDVEEKEKTDFEAESDQQAENDQTKEDHVTSTDQKKEEKRIEEEKKADEQKEEKNQKECEHVKFGSAQKENTDQNAEKESKAERDRTESVQKSEDKKKPDKDKDKKQDHADESKSDPQPKDGKTDQSRANSRPHKAASQKPKRDMLSRSPYAKRKETHAQHRDGKDGRQPKKSAKRETRVKQAGSPDVAERKRASPDRSPRGQTSDVGGGGDSDRVKEATTDQSDVAGSQTEAEVTERMLNGADEDSNDSSSSTSSTSSSDSEAEPIDMREYHRKRRQEEEAAEKEEIRRLDRREQLLRHRLVSATKKKDRRELKSAIGRYRRHVTSATCRELSDAKRMEHVVRLRDELLQEVERGDLEEIRRLLDLIEVKGFTPDIQYEVSKARTKVKAAEATPRFPMSPVDSSIPPLSEIRRFRHPTEFVHHLLVAGLLLMGVHEGRTKRWRTCQRNIVVTGLRGLYQRTITLRVDEIHPEVAVRARELLSQLDAEQAANCCAAVLSFYNWVTRVIDEALEQYGDSSDIVPANKKRQRRIFKEQMKILQGKRPKPGVLNVIRKQDSDDDDDDVTLTGSDDDDDDDEEESPRRYSASDEGTATVENSRESEAAAASGSREGAVTSERGSSPSTRRSLGNGKDGESDRSRDEGSRRHSNSSSQSASDASSRRSAYDVRKGSKIRSSSPSSTRSSRRS